MHHLSVRVSNTVFEDRSLDDRAMAFFRNLHKSSLGECPDILLINHKVGFAFLFGYSNLRSTNIPLLVMSRLDNIETHTELKELVQVPPRSSEMKGKRRTLVSLQLVIRNLDSFTKVYTSSVSLVFIYEVIRYNLIYLSISLLCLAHFSVSESIFHPQSAQKMSGTHYATDLKVSKGVFILVFASMP